MSGHRGEVGQKVFGRNRTRQSIGKRGQEGCPKVGARSLDIEPQRESLASKRPLEMMLVRGRCGEGQSWPSARMPVVQGGRIDLQRRGALPQQPVRLRDDSNVRHDPLPIERAHRITHRRRARPGLLRQRRQAARMARQRGVQHRGHMPVRRHAVAQRRVEQQLLPVGRCVDQRLPAPPQRVLVRGDHPYAHRLHARAAILEQILQARVVRPRANGCRHERITVAQAAVLPAGDLRAAGPAKP